ncbi:type II secretion system F family protein [Ponticoccus sp. SC2-23]|nr:type II secretion system F family protein [Ponticoccus sp. SC6-9]MBM1227475.1 type II secretion system F family protein [Ponticoccus sp. SC6-15]MBM1231995.1 type II secretion system F family protein [Ponticoccus sp. SC6-38]MBM1236494.1 type II secretion system F family protein [Ponticoccus sp. SC6-45]MBM1241010.1 type II secretion system F family protein [Ponticoccus sp. SC6-49]MBM1245515.1 type II secretion system F family protein [Ponticoccus sp. SC2-64]MBM1245552.1 type II secretion sys
MTLANLQLEYLIPILAGLTVAFLGTALGGFKSDHRRTLDRRIKELDESRLAERDRRRDPNAGLQDTIVSQAIGTVRRLIGKQIDRLTSQSHLYRDRIVAAGIRSKDAWFYVLIAKLILPIVGVIIVQVIDSITSFSVLQPMLYLMLMLGSAVFLFFAPDIWLRLRVNERLSEAQRYWQDAVDLLVICVEAGLTIEESMRRVAREVASFAPVIAQELVITVGELTILSERRSAYSNLANRLNISAVRSTVVVLIQSEKQGASVSRALRAIATANREDLAAAADQKAGSLGPKMTIPMILFFLPVLFILLISPIYLKSIQ